MKLTYATKYNGKIYNAGEEIPVDEDKKVVETKTEIKVEKPADEVVEEKPKKATKKK